MRNLSDHAITDGPMQAERERDHQPVVAGEHRSKKRFVRRASLNQLADRLRNARIARMQSSGGGRLDILSF